MQTCFSYSFNFVKLLAMCSRMFLKVLVLISEFKLTLESVSMHSAASRAGTEEGSSARAASAEQ